MSRIRFFVPQSACALALAAFALAGSAQAGNFRLLHDFKGRDGGLAMAGLIRDNSGNLFGTTFLGGRKNGGVVFELTSNGKETVLHDFLGGNDGNAPYGNLIADQQGNLYGTTESGGGSSRFGTVFKLAPDGTETILYAFTDGSDGGNPVAGLLADASGNLYSTTMAGGENGQGTVFELSPDGSETVLHSFANGSDGAEPVAGLIADKHGNFYGTTFTGGSGGNGTAFKLAPGGTETILFSFSLGNSSGADPDGSLVADDKGNLYGTTGIGGSGNCQDGCGVVFEIAANGQFSDLYSFTGGADGANPYASLIRDKKGNFYGTTVGGGSGCGGCGAVFKLTPDGKETTLYSFNGTKDGAHPYAQLFLDGQGDLFGTASIKGLSCLDYAISGCGTVFEVKN
jgi:uncharacterized repeat protein (TIGR03803 family)